MEIVRAIGRHDVLVETREPRGLYFAEGVIPLDPVSGESSLSKQEILRMLSSGDEYLPLTLHWELLDKCNFACPFCYIVGHSTNRLVRFAEIKPHLEALIDAGMLFATLTGGEATIHPDFIDIYRLLKNGGVLVEVYSNGYSFDDTLISLFQELPPSAVEISLYSLDDDKLREKYGAHGEKPAMRVLENVVRLQAAGINVVCKTFLTTLTQPEEQAIARWCKDHNLEHYTSSDITQGYDGANLGAYQIKSKETPIHFERSAKQAVCLPCGTKNYGSAIDSSFALYPCPSIRLPDCRFNLRELGVAEAIKQMKAFMRKFQSKPIEGAPSGVRPAATCIAMAKPVRTSNGGITHFEQP